MQRHSRALRVCQQSGLLVAVLLWLCVGGLVEAQTAWETPEQLRMARLPQVEGRSGGHPTKAFVRDEPRFTSSELQEPPTSSSSDTAAPMPAEVISTPRWEMDEAVGGPYLTPDWLQSELVELANLNCDGQQWLQAFRSRIQEESQPPQTAPVSGLPVGFQAWWDRPVRAPSTPALRVAIGQLVEGALQYSSYIQMVSTEPRILNTAVVEEQAVFDWRGFLETTYNDTNEPVGNILTTGNLDERYLDRTWSSNGGVRRDNRLGGNVELSQQLGGEQNNSRFLLPNPQATTQLELRYTQPLLKRAGRAYNESRIVLAEIHAEMSSDKLAEDLESHLIKVTEAYWELYRARAEYLQRVKLLTSAESALDLLEAREGVDAVQRQVLRARAAVATRRSEIVRARTSIRNAESLLRLLVNDPALVQAGVREFAPADAPLTDELPVAIDQSLFTALQHRPDISSAIREIRASAVRLGVAKKDILPKLDFVASTYVAGLANQTDIGRSLSVQFDEGSPSYSVGLLFEVPFGRRAACAQEDRRRWEMYRAFSQFRLTVEEALTAVEVAVREVGTNYREMAGRYHAMVAVTDEADYLSDRWQALPGADDSAMLLLENLLDAQERVAVEEAAFVRAQVGYAMSVVRLKQEMGTLLILTPFVGDRVAAIDGAQRR
ncbi:MAG: TolC family protein [Pirellulaceae bacterium]